VLNISLDCNGQSLHHLSKKVSHKVGSLLIVLVPDGRFMKDERALIKFPVLFGLRFPFSLTLSLLHIEHNPKQHSKQEITKTPGTICVCVQGIANM